MRTRFLHMADCHLGYRQYNLTERFNDFGRAFLQVIDTAVQEEVDFVLLAGDLFHKRAIDALTLNQAVAGLERLQRANIPCIAVEGNHEHAYIDDFIGWMKFLALRQYIYLLDTDFQEGKPRLGPYAQRTGSYMDPVPGVRVHGLRYMGAGTKTAIAAYADAMADLPDEGIEYAIFMTHAGIEGEVDQMSGLSMADWRPMRDHADYVALGHIHKPFNREGWLYNPGSLETCASAEAVWHDRGYYLVDVDTERGPEGKHTAKLHAIRRRPFARLTMKTDLLQSPEDLYTQARELMERRARDLGVNRLDEDERPVVDLYLHGVLHFDRSSLDMGELETMLQEVFNPLHVIVRNATRSSDFAVETGEGVSRSELERQVLADLFARDARFQSRSEGWARAAISIKNMMLQQADAETVLQELEGEISRLGDETDLEALGAAAHEAAIQETARQGTDQPPPNGQAAPDPAAGAHEAADDERDEGEDGVH